MFHHGRLLVVILQKSFAKFLKMNANQFYTWEEAVRWLTAQPDQQVLVEACYYDQPLRSAADRYWQSEEWQSLQQYLPPTPGYALDIGAGNGISSYALAKDGWQVAALEPDLSDLVGSGAIRQLAKASQLPITVTQEFGERLPFTDASFDFVFARQVLHHAQDLPQLCHQIQRVLKPGGMFIAVRDHVISHRDDLPKFLEIHPLHKLYSGENAFLLDEYKNALQAAGLLIQQIIKPFESVINYGPRTQTDLKAEFQQRFQCLPLGHIPAKLLLHDRVFPSFLKALAYFDQRPGRLYTFITQKPGAMRP
jgi:ubiquinone/menaquinone biosynthesis C-methylase UbiE